MVLFSLRRDDLNMYKEKYAQYLIITLLVLLLFWLYWQFSDYRLPDNLKKEDIVLATIGPNGEPGLRSDILYLTTAQQAKITGMKLSAAVVLHESTSLFSTSITRGLRQTLKLHDIELVYLGFSEFDANLQEQQLKEALLLKPDILITLIIEPIMAAKVLANAQKNGTIVTLLSNLPDNFQHPQQYAGIVTDDLFLIGRKAASLINQSIKNKELSSGKVALFYHDANYYVTNQRDRAVESVITLSFPEINIIKRIGLSDINQTKSLTLELLKEHPDINAIYAPWASIGQGVLSALKQQNRSDIALVTIDLDEILAEDMLSSGNVTGIVSDLPFDIAQSLVTMALLAHLGEPTPPFVTVTALSITKHNLKQRWFEIFKTTLQGEGDEN